MIKSTTASGTLDSGSTGSTGMSQLTSRDKEEATRRPRRRRRMTERGGSTAPGPSSSGLPSQAEPPSSQGPVVQEAPPECLAEQQRLRESLAQRPFLDDSAALDGQRQLEEQYIAEAAQANVGRARYLNRGGGAEVAPSAATTILAASLDGLAGFASSASRSPAANAVVAQLSPAKGFHPGEFSNRLDPVVVGGVTGGLAAYVAGFLLTAAQRTARANNVAEVKAVDLKVLLPPPPRIRLTITDEGRKRYEVHDAASYEQALRAVKEQRSWLKQWIRFIEGKGLVGANLKPLLTGALNATRRSASSDADLLTPGRLWGRSVLASGGAAAIAKGGSGLLKAWPTQLKDFDGQDVAATLYEVVRRHADRPPAGFASLRRLPAGVAGALREARAMALASARTGRDFSHTLLDLSRHMLANTIAAITSQGGGLLWASLRWKTTEAPRGESLRSRAYALRQAATSYYNDLAWDSAKGFLDPAVPGPAAKLDEWRSMRELELARLLPESLGRIRQALSALRDQTPAAEVAGGLDVWDAEQQAISSDVVAEQIDHVRRRLESVAEERPEEGRLLSDVLRELRALQSGLDELIAIRRSTDPQAPATWSPPAGAPG